MPILARPLVVGYWTVWGLGPYYAFDSHEFRIFYTLRIFTAHIDHIYKSIGVAGINRGNLTATRRLTDTLVALFMYRNNNNILEDRIL